MRVMGLRGGVAVWIGGGANRQWGVAQTEATRTVDAVATNTQDYIGGTCRERPVMYRRTPCLYERSRG